MSNDIATRTAYASMLGWSAAIFLFVGALHAQTGWQVITVNSNYTEIKPPASLWADLVISNITLDGLADVSTNGAREGYFLGFTNNYWQPLPVSFSLITNQFWVWSLSSNTIPHNTFTKPNWTDGYTGNVVDLGQDVIQFNGTGWVTIIVRAVIKHMAASTWAAVYLRTGGNATVQAGPIAWNILAGYDLSMAATFRFYNESATNVWIITCYQNDSDAGPEYLGNNLKGGLWMAGWREAK